MGRGGGGREEGGEDRVSSPATDVSTRSGFSTYDSSAEGSGEDGGGARDGGKESSAGAGECL